MLHFGMTGSLSYRRNGARLPPYTRLLIDFGRNRRLAYVDPRKLGRIALAGSPRRFVEAHRLGPDALALDMAGFGKLVAAKRGAIKSWLMDQHAIAASSAACSPSFKKCSGKPSRPGPILRGCRSRFSCPGAGAGALCPRCRGRVKACPPLVAAVHRGRPVDSRRLHQYPLESRLRLLEHPSGIGSNRPTASPARAVRM